MLFAGRTAGFAGKVKGYRIPGLELRVATLSKFYIFPEKFEVTLSKSERRKQQKILLKKQERQSKVVYAVVIACIVLFMAVYWLKPLGLGSDIRYDIFVVALPVVIGIGLFISYRKKLLDMEVVAAETMWNKIWMSTVLLTIIGLFSYLTLGFFTSLTFEVINYNLAEDSKQQIVLLPIDEFHEGHGSKATHSIRFHFNGEKENMRVSRNFIKQCIEKSAAKHRIKLKLRKGLWNHYLVDEWDIVK